MKKLFNIYIILTCTLMILPAYAETDNNTKQVVLMPVKQANIPEYSKISDSQLKDSFIVKMTMLQNFEPVDFGELAKAFDNNLIDEAVFEILVTDDLKQTLDKLDRLQTKKVRLAEYCKVGKEHNIDFLIDISIRQDRTQLRITYKIIDTETAKTVSAKSFYDIPNDPIGVSNEISKRVIRKLWKLENKK